MAKPYHMVLTLCFNDLISSLIRHLVGDTITKIEEKTAKQWTAKEWAEKCELLQTWIDEHTQKKYEDTCMVLTLNMSRGKKDASSRPKFWTQMLQEMRDIPDSPIGGRGIASNLPEEVQAVLKIVEPALIVEQTHEGHYTRLVTFTRKSTGKGKDKVTIRTFHENDVARATAWAKGKISMLKKMYNEDIWDGTEAGLLKIANLLEADIENEVESNE